MSSVHIEHISESFVRIDTEVGILREIAGRFAFRVEGFQFNPRYKAGIWDGYIRPVNTKNGLCPKGLVPKVIQYIRDSSYDFTLDTEFQRFKEQIDFDYTTLNLPFVPHDFQLKAVDILLTKKRQVILSATGSGKSLVTYLMVHAILAKILDGQKILITVPTISLVSQLFNDFKDYSVNNSWDVDEYVHTIIGGSKKHTSKPIIISTWQSLHTIKEREYFEQFGAIIGDECHTTAASSLSAIMEKSINAFYRIGLSGTLSGTQIAEMALIGHFGPISRVSSTADLIDRDILAKLKIFLLTLTYPEEICNSVKYLDYAGEMDWIVKCEQRNKYIVNLSNELKGNTLILVQYIEKHGKVLEQMLRSKCKDKQVFFVYGDTEAEDRESVRRITEKRNDVIILASYQVFSTGVNIKNLPNIILGSSTKSTIRLLQSIGRGLRKHDEKEYCKIFDITDDLRGKRKKLNYTLKHCMERLKIYQTEGFDITEKTITIKGM